MAKVLIPTIVIVIAALILIPQTFFTVDETQLAIVTQFGAFKEAHTEPGLYTKTPFVQTVTRFDKRLLRVDSPAASLLTADKRNLVIDAYARYRILDPLLFFQKLTNETNAAARVGDIVNSQLRREVALDLQTEIISETREQVMRRVTDASNRVEIDRTTALALDAGLRTPLLQIVVTPVRGGDVPIRGHVATEEEVAALEREAAPPEFGSATVTYYLPIRSEWGIEVVDVRIKRADFPPDIADSVFARMRAERERIASGLRAAGQQRDREIRATVDRDVEIILQTAQGTAQQLRGEAEQEAIQILAKALERDPEFYAFRRTLEAYRAFLDENTTVLLDADSDLLRLLQDPNASFTN